MQRHQSKMRQGRQHKRLIGVTPRIRRPSQLMVQNHLSSLKVNDLVPIRVIGIVKGEPPAQRTDAVMCLLLGLNTGTNLSDRNIRISRRQRVIELGRPILHQNQTGLAVMNQKPSQRPQPILCDLGQGPMRIEE